MMNFPTSFSRSSLLLFYLDWGELYCINASYDSLLIVPDLVLGRTIAAWYNKRDVHEPKADQSCEDSAWVSW